MLIPDPGLVPELAQDAGQVGPVGRAEPAEEAARPRRRGLRGSPYQQLAAWLGQGDQRRPPVVGVGPPLDEPAVLAGRPPPRWSSGRRCAGSRTVRAGACRRAGISTPSAARLARRDVPRARASPGTARAAGEPPPRTRRTGLVRRPGWPRPGPEHRNSLPPASCCSLISEVTSAISHLPMRGSLSAVPDRKRVATWQPHTDSPSSGRRTRGSRTVTAAEKAQAREVSLRRIGRLFTPYRGQTRRRHRHHRGLVGRRDGLAVPAARRHRHARCRTGTCTLLVWLVVGMVAVAAVTSAFGVVQTWISTKVGQQVMHRPAHRRLRPPAAPVDRVLHPHPDRRGAVAHHQRHRRHGVGRHLDRDVHRVQPDHRRRHRRGDGRAVVAAVAACRWS